MSSALEGATGEVRIDFRFGCDLAAWRLVDRGADVWLVSLVLLNLGCDIFNITNVMSQSPSAGSCLYGITFWS